MKLSVLERGGVGQVVQGTVWSAGLVLSDARRQDQSLAWFLNPEGILVGLDPSVSWEAHEVVAGEWTG